MGLLHDFRYDYGAIDPKETFDDYPVMREDRWCLTNGFKIATQVNRKIEPKAIV